MDHDQRFKTLIQEFFAEFLALFFDGWAQRLNTTKVEWLDKEVFPDPPAGHRRSLDLVAKVATREAVTGMETRYPNEFVALVHIEIESPDRAAPLRSRMFHAYAHLREKHGLAVLPIAIYLKVSMKGLGVDVFEEWFWNWKPVQFEYLYVGLPGLDAVEYVQGESWLGVALAALMRIPEDRAAWLGAEALRRISGAPLTEQQRFLLAECIQAYLPLDDDQQREFDRLAASDGYQGIKAMNTTWFEKGVQQGLEKGRRETIRELLELSFGPLSNQAEARLQQLSLEQLRDLIKLVGRASSLQELGLED